MTKSGFQKWNATNEINLTVYNVEKDISVSVDLFIIYNVQENGRSETLASARKRNQLWMLVWVSKYPGENCARLQNLYAVNYGYLVKRYLIYWA